MPRRKPVSVSDDFEVSQADFARIMGYSTRQVRNLEAEGLPHRSVRNRKWYPVPEAVNWIRERDKAEVLRGLEITDVDAIRMRKLEAEAAAKELELEERRGQLMFVAHHHEILGIVFDRIRARLTAWSATLPPLLIGLEVEREAQAVLAPAVDDVLEQLQGVAEDPPDEGSHEAA